MDKLIRLASGLSFGTVLALAALVVSPGTASADSYQCTDTKNYNCCCQLAGDLIQWCDCTRKPEPIIV